MALRLADLNATAVERTAPFGGGKHIEAQHLFNMFQLQPTVFLGDVVQQAFSNKKQIITPLYSALTGSGNTSYFSEIQKNVQTIGTDEYEWYLATEGDNSDFVVANLEIGNPAIGYGFTNGQGTTFKVKMKTNYFKQGDQIAPDDAEYLCRVVAELGGNEATGFIYELQLNSQLSIPESFLQRGQRWRILGMSGNNIFEGVSTGGNGFRPGDVLHKFKNRLGEYKLTVGLSRKALNTDLSTSRLVQNGKQPSLIAIDTTKSAAYQISTKGTDYINYAYDKSVYNDSYMMKPTSFWMWKGETMFFKSWYELLEEQLWYGQQYTNTHADATGHIMYAGSGIKELLRFSNQMKVNHFSAETYEEFLSMLSYDRLKVESNKVFTAYGGTKAIEELDKALKTKLTQNGIFVYNDKTVLTPTSSTLHKNAFAYGYQITQYNMINGISLRIVHNPIYDSAKINPMKHPTMPNPLESWKLTFLNLDLENADSQNVCIVKGGDPKFHLFDGIGSNRLSPSNRTPYDEMMIMGKYGIWIKDLTACGEISLSYV